MSDECECPLCIFNRLYTKIEVEGHFDPAEFATTAALMLLYHIKPADHAEFIGGYLLPALFHASLELQAETPRNTKGMH